MDAATSIKNSVRLIRKSLGMTQVEFAKAVGARQSSVTEWENGKSTPTSEYLVKIASLTTDEGLKRQLLEASGLADFIPQSGTEVNVKDFPTLNIRLLRDPAAAGTPRMVDEREVEKLLVLPRFMFPEGSGEIVAIRIKGRSMEPLLLPGSIVFIDVSRRDAKELVGAMVAARVDGGVTVKFLRKTRNEYILLPYHISPRYEPIPLSDLEGDAIIGKVLLWQSQPPEK